MVPGPQRCAHRSGALVLALATVLCALSASRVPAARETVEAPLDVRDAAAPARTTSPEPRGNPLWGIPLSELSATGERPIFSPSRRPPAPAVFAVAAAEPPRLAPPPPEPTRPPLALVGTIIGETRQIGVFLEETTRETVRLAAGEGHSGWVLRAVDKAGVHFERGERAATLLLRPPDQNKAPGPEAVPTAALMPPVRHRKRDRNYDQPAVP
jgi:general secretion pathway protein N